jgi:hypothetical protein
MLSTKNSPNFLPHLLNTPSFFQLSFHNTLAAYLSLYQSVCLALSGNVHLQLFYLCSPYAVFKMRIHSLSYTSYTIYFLN